MAADEDGWSFWPGGARVTGSVPQLIPATGKRASAAPQRAHYLDSLAKSRDPLPVRGPWHPEGCRVISRATCTQAQYDPTATGRIQGGCHLGHHSRMAVRIGENQRNRNEFSRGLGERGQSGPAFRPRGSQNVIERGPVVAKALAFLPHLLQL